MKQRLKRRIRNKIGRFLYPKIDRIMPNLVLNSRGYNIFRGDVKLRNYTEHQQARSSPHDNLKDNFATGRSEKNGASLARAQTTWHGRYKAHGLFFKKHGGNIRSFADIGCALPRGAPTTINARKVLPAETKVYAVDIAGDFNNPKLRRKSITPLKHNIVDAPLYRPVDAIMFAAVSGYLTPENRDKALQNIHESLNRGGFLLSHDRVYRKKGEGFEEIGQFVQ